MFLNILALLLVIAILAGSLWLYNHFASRRRRRGELLDGDFEVNLDASESHPPCPACKGTGAKNRLGNILTCNACDGTGVASLQKNR